MLTAVLLLLAADAGFATADLAVEPNPKVMSRAEIRAHNAGLDRQHPFFIRCVRSAAIGSLVARIYSCRTNHQWTIAEDVGNQEARDISDQMRSKSWNTSG